MTVGAYNANLGIGDLLVYAIFTVAAYKGRMRQRLNALVATATGGLAPDRS